VFIDPTASLTVSGPGSDTSVRSLQIGGGSGLAALDLAPGVTLTATEGMTIQSTGTLTGQGTIVGDVLALGHLRPGSSPGSIFFDGALTMGSTTNNVFELGTSEFDQLIVTGDLNLNDSLTVELFGPFTLGSNQSWEIIDLVGTLTGEFDGFSDGTLVGNFGGTDLFINYQSGNGVFVVSAVPEPSSILLLTGLFGLTALRRQSSVGSLTALQRSLSSEDLRRTVLLPGDRTPRSSEVSGRRCPQGG